MIGMGFSAFVTLLVLGLIVSFVFHVVGRYRVLDGFDGFMGGWIAAWIGGWLGSPVFGHWGFHVGNLYIIPAILGACAGAFLAAAFYKALAAAFRMAPRESAKQTQPGVTPQLEIRKAS